MLIFLDSLELLRIWNKFGALDEVSLWFGRVDDIINECKTINKLNDKISVLFDAVQIQGNLPTIHVVVSDFVIKIAIDVKTYPLPIWTILLIKAWQLNNKQSLKKQSYNLDLLLTPMGD